MHHSQYRPLSSHASGRSSPAQASSTKTGVAAPRALGLERRRPDDERQVRDVDVAARGQEREVEARAQQRGGREADERRERRRAPGGTGPRRATTNEASVARDHDAVGGVAQRATARAPKTTASGCSVGAR